MSIAGEPRYHPSSADDNGVLHNNVPTSAGGAGATRTSRRADKGREMRRRVAQRAGGWSPVVTDSQSNRQSAGDVTSQQDFSRARRRNCQDLENPCQLMSLCNRRSANAGQE